VSIVVVATIYPKPDQRDAVIKAFEEAIEAVHSEDGCELYALHTGTDRLVMIEKWSSESALDVHSKGPALKRLGAALDGRVAGPTDLQVLQIHPAGTPELGVL
jgi:quinol monooxygenase YgiN